MRGKENIIEAGSIEIKLHFRIIAEYNHAFLLLFDSNML